MSKIRDYIGHTLYFCVTAKPLLRCDLELTWSNTLIHPTHTEWHCWFIIETVTVKDPPDVLDRQKCLDALAALRHAKWFQVRLFVLFTLQPYVLYILLYSLNKSVFLNDQS